MSHEKDKEKMIDGRPQGMKEVPTCPRSQRRKGRQGGGNNS